MEVLVKLLCIKGSLFWGIVKGRVYERFGDIACCPRNDNPLYLIDRGRQGRIRCNFCFKRVQCPAGPKRNFMPLTGDDLGVTMEEVSKLYQPSLDKEKETT